jgi:hypothetical protein
MHKVQRKAYNDKRKNIKPGEVMIISDFKENIKLRRGPVEVSQDFYHRKQCSVLCFQVVYFNQNFNKIKTVNVDFFSDIMSKDAVFVKECFERVMEKIYQLCPGLAPIKKLNFWTDVGQHFRCEEVAHYVLVEIPGIFDINVTWDTFVECHGKSTVDSHFGVLSQWVDDFTDKKKIDTVQDLVKALQNKIRKSKKDRSASNRPMYKLFIYEQDSRPIKYKRLSIENIKRYYHFETKKNDEGQRVLKIKVTSESPYISEEIFTKPIKVVERIEKRVTKYSTACTEESSQTKVQKMGVDQVCYGPNTTRRLLWQAGNL